MEKYSVTLLWNTANLFHTRKQIIFYPSILYHWFFSGSRLPVASTAHLYFLWLINPNSMSIFMSYHYFGYLQQVWVWCSSCCPDKYIFVKLSNSQPYTISWGKCIFGNKHMKTCFNLILFYCVWWHCWRVFLTCLRIPRGHITLAQYLWYAQQHSKMKWCLWSLKPESYRTKSISQLN